MKTLIYTLSALMFLGLNSCHKKTQKEIEADYLSSLINRLHVGSNVKWVIILPGLGCHGCIQEGEGFMQKNIKNKDVFFILTQIESLKILQNKIGINLQQTNNVFADKDNSINIPSDNEIYPCIIELENGKIIGHEFQSPQNWLALEDLKTRLSATSSKN